jgi:hypothetical protein
MTQATPSARPHDTAPLVLPLVQPPVMDRLRHPSGAVRVLDQLSATDAGPWLLAQMPDGAPLTLTTLITAVRVLTTGNGFAWATLTATGPNGAAFTAVVFPHLWAKHSARLSAGGNVVLAGRVCRNLRRRGRAVLYTQSAHYLGEGTR